MNPGYNSNGEEKEDYKTANVNPAKQNPLTSV